MKVALSGDGGDELFAGYQTYAADALKRRFRMLPAPLLTLGRKLALLLPVSNDKIGFEYKVARFLGGLSLPAVQAHLSWNGTFSEKEGLYQYYEPAVAHSFL